MNFPVLQLPPQLFCSTTPFDKSKLQTVSMILHPKPHGGLWTSPVEDDSLTSMVALQSSWTQWAKNGHGVGEHQTILYSEPARVAVVDSYEDQLRLIENYPVDRLKLSPQEQDTYELFMSISIPDGFSFFLPQIDWVALSQDADAVYLTKRGNASAKQHALTSAFSGWDCESVLWLQPQLLEQTHSIKSNTPQP